MPSVTIQFEGICVNFRQTDFPFLPTAHRIVLINASTISSVWDHNIALHTAGYSTSLSATAPSYPLEGATVQIANPVKSGGVQYDSTYNELMPSLTRLTPGLSGVSMALLLGHNPMLASCYFDVDYGCIGAKPSPFGAIMTIVTVETTDAPTYSVQPFPSGLSWTPIIDVQAQPATDKMYFWNEELNPAGASDDDFLLSYLVVNWPPGPQPNIPKAIPGGKTANRKSTLIGAQPILTTDVGCSNSSYP